MAPSESDMTASHFRPRAQADAASNRAEGRQPKSR